MQPIGEYVKLDLDVDMEGLSDSDGRSFEFRGRNSLRRVDCNNPTLFNKKKLNKDDYWRHFYLSGNREL
jgi:hypothetical protein